MRLDAYPSPLRPADPPPRTRRNWWGPFYAGVLTAAVGLGSIVVFGLTNPRLLFGLAGLALAWVGWFRRDN